MKNNNLTAIQLSVLSVMKKEPLTSFQILSKVENISMILSLYTIMDQLKNKGAIESYTKENIKYHIAC
jgi:DNA-binding PadR family transcriptional regulator